MIAHSSSRGFPGLLGLMALAAARRITFTAPLCGFAHKGFVQDQQQPPRIYWSFDYLYEIARNTYTYTQPINKFFHSVA